jgi:hypothetical protein
MGYFSELAIELRVERELGPTRVDGNDLATFAAALGGEVDGRFIRCPSPGCSDDDRSCFVRIDGPGRFYIYECQGSLGRAYAELRKKLGGEAAPPRNDYSDYIRDILAEAVPATGTIAETYLRTRGLTVELPPALRFHRMLKHTPTGTWHPVMVAERRSASGQLVAIHRTFLRHDGSGKANVGEPVRMDLGSWKGTAIRLSPVSEELLIGEGIETTLSVMQATGRPGWAAGSAGALRGLVLPPEVRSVLICADGDDPGEQAAKAATVRWRREGRRVQVTSAPKGYDFNDVLMGRAR